VLNGQNAEQFIRQLHKSRRSPKTIISMLVAAGYSEDLAAALVVKTLAESAPEKPAQKPPAPEPSASEIVCNGDWKPFKDKILPILQNMTRRELLFLLEGEPRPVQLSQEGTIHRFKADELVYRVGRLPLDCGNQYVRLTAKSVESAPIPERLVKTLLARPEEIFAPVQHIVRSAAALQPGLYLPAPGLHEDTRTFGAFEPREVPPMKLTEALAFIRELVSEFEFRTPADFADWLAEPLSLLLKDALPGVRFPAFRHRAPQAESGKTLLALVGLAAREPADALTVFPAAGSEGVPEVEKRLIAALRERPAAVLLDNFDGFTTSDLYEALLTAGSATIRPLGTSETVHIAEVPVFVLTQNPPPSGFKASTLRREIWVTLEPRSPLASKAFRRPNLEADIRENRDGLRWRFQDALVALTDNWEEWGSPPFSGPPLNGFCEWSATIGGIIETAGVPGFLSNRAFMFSHLDGEFESRAALLETLLELFEGQEFRSYDCAVKTTAFEAAFRLRGLELSDAVPENTARAWGRVLSKLVGATGFRAVLRSRQNRDKVNVYEVSHAQ